jgi:hypothetical protein
MPKQQNHSGSIRKIVTISSAIIFAMLLSNSKNLAISSANIFFSIDAGISQPAKPTNELIKKKRRNIIKKSSK